MGFIAASIAFVLDSLIGPGAGASGGGELAHLSFQEITVPEDIGPDLRMLDETLAGTRSSYTLEKRYRHKDGHIVWVQLTVALVRTPAGAPDYLISVVQDLSAQKAAEEALRPSQNLMSQAQKLANIGACQADLATGRIGNLTKSESFLSFPSNEYGIKDMLDMIHPDDRLRVMALWPRAVKGEAVYEIEYRVVLDGHEYWHSVKAEFERDPQGRAIRALGVTQNITERRRRRPSLRRRQEKGRKSSRRRHAVRRFGKRRKDAFRAVSGPVHDRVDIPADASRRGRAERRRDGSDGRSAGRVETDVSRGLADSATFSMIRRFTASILNSWKIVTGRLLTGW